MPAPGTPLEKLGFLTIGLFDAPDPRPGHETTDSATGEQRAKYAAYVEARSARNGIPQGPGRLLFAQDLVGTSGQIAEALYAHAGFREVREVVFALPFSFEHQDYVQILTDIATRLGPALGWRSADHA
jgi:hypothetical protein